MLIFKALNQYEYGVSPRNTSDSNLLTLSKSPVSTQGEVLKDKTSSIQSKLIPIQRYHRQISLASSNYNSPSPKASLTKEPPSAEISNIEQMPNTTPKELKRSQTMHIAPIPEGNENSEQTMNKSNSKAFISPLYRTNSRLDVNNAPQQTIRPSVEDKFSIPSSNKINERVTMINIAGIRNKEISPQKEERTLLRGASELPLDSESNEQLLMNLSQSQAPRRLQTQKSLKYRSNLLRNMNRIKNNTKGLSRNASRKTSDALPSIFDLTNELNFNEISGLPSGLLDDSDFFTNKQRYELLKRKKLKKKSQVLRSPHRKNKERANFVSKLEDSEENNEIEEEDEKDKIVIDVRYLKPVPNYKKEYSSMSTDDILPTQKEREVEKLEESERKIVRESRLKLFYKVTRSDRRKAKERTTAFYKKTEGTSYLPVQANIHTERVRREMQERKAIEEQLNKGEEEFGSKNSSTRFVNMSRRTGFKATSKTSGQGSKGSFHGSRSGNAGTRSQYRHLNRLNDEDYLPEDKMNDFAEVLKTIQKPFDNEEEIDNIELEAKKTAKEFNYIEDFKAIRVKLPLLKMLTL